MSTSLRIETTSSGLLVRVKASTVVWRIAVAILGGGFFSYVIVRQASFPRSADILALIFLLFAIIREIISAARGTDVELRVENLNFVSTGHAPGGYTRGTVSRDDLLRLDYRAASGGGDDPEYPGGLYVEYNSDSAWETRICALPHITEQQTEEVIAAIRREFPEIDKLTQGRPAHSPLISLNLNR